MQLSNNSLAGRKVRDGSVAAFNVFDEEPDNPALFSQVA